MVGNYWQRFAPFYLYPSVALALVMAAAAHPERPPSPRELIALLLTGCLSWGLIEYLLHRFIFHDGSESVRASLGAAHLAHHADPRSTAQLFAALRFSAPIAAAYFVLVWVALGDWRSAAYVFSGLIGGYLTYEILHYRAHHARPRLKLFKYLQRYHMLHHYRTPGARFGVTSPVFDCLFGTFRK